MLQHRQDGVTYNGFAKFSNHRDASRLNVQLVIVWFDGEPDLWLVEGLDGIAALAKFYRDEWGDREMPTQVFAPLAVE